MASCRAYGLVIVTLTSSGRDEYTPYVRVETSSPYERSRCTEYSNDCRDPFVPTNCGLRLSARLVFPMVLGLTPS